MDTLRQRYAGQWVAISQDQVIVSSMHLPDLLTQLAGHQQPFITFIPSEPTIWTFTYAHKGF